MANTAKANEAEIRAAHTELYAKVKELAKELPGITLGYLGNIESWGDDREWHIFLPHPGRVGSYKDRVVIAETASLPNAVRDWDQVAGTVRRLYHSGERRA